MTAQPASITVYLPDDHELPEYLALFTAIGFRDYDWCELRKDGSDVVVTYGPCEAGSP